MNRIKIDRLTNFIGNIFFYLKIILKIGLIFVNSYLVSNPTYGSNKNWKARDFYAAGRIHAYCHFPNAFWYQICICHHSGNIELWLLSTLIGHCKNNQKRIWNRYICKAVSKIPLYKNQENVIKLNWFRNCLKQT